MKKFIVFLVLVILFTVAVGSIVYAESVSEEEIIEAGKNIKDVAVGIHQIGFINWLKVNWWFFILSIVGTGSIIVKLTPSKNDDVWFNKYIIGSVHFVGQIMSLDIKGIKAKK